MTLTTRPRFLYAKSTEPTSMYRACPQKFSDVTSVYSIDELANRLPPMKAVEALTIAFFDESNWRYGIPEDWFHTARRDMWSSLHHSGSTTSNLNANWLMLLFAILASAPPSAHKDVQHLSPYCGTDGYFMYAMMARRMAEDDFLSEPNQSFMVSAADGTVVGCLATPILCDYLAARGRVSEAWKLIGQAIRNAMSVGLHRDPESGLWQQMSGNEILLRRCAWWALFMSDKSVLFLFIFLRVFLIFRLTTLEFFLPLWDGPRYCDLECTTSIALAPRTRTALGTSPTLAKMYS